MSSNLHTITYKELFNGHEFTKPIVVKASKGEKVIIFSDSHIQKKFDRHQYDHLLSTIAKGDIIIINGDLWWDSHITFAEFINGKWDKLLKLLKSKRTYYLFGNHDMPFLSDERIYNFCDEAGFKLRLISGDEVFNVEHGHLLSSRLIKTILIIFEKRPRLLSIATYPFGILHDLSRVLFMRNGTKVMKSVNSSHKKKNGKKGEWLVTGHTHVPEVDHENKYINLGFTHKGYFSWLEIIDGKFVLHEERV